MKTIVAQLDRRLWFPDPADALADGLVAVGGDLSVERLVLGYRSGVFPWTAQPITWWSPEPRAIFQLDDFHIPRSLARTLRRAEFEITWDRCFSEVIRACAVAPRREGANWISPDFVRAYTALHRAGYAHSAEVWLDGKLAGGVYGVAVGAFFAGESMFHKATDASKVALVHLLQRLRRSGFQLFDTQMLTPTTRLLGAFEVPRGEYLGRLSGAVSASDCWQNSPSP